MSLQFSSPSESAIHDIPPANTARLLQPLTHPTQPVKLSYGNTSRNEFWAENASPLWMPPKIFQFMCSSNAATSISFSILQNNSVLADVKQ